MSWWRAYYDDYGEAAIPELGVPGRPGTMLVAPVPFDGDRILVDGLTPEAAEKVVAALNDAARALAEIERLEKALRELVGAWQALRLLQGGEHTLEDSMRAYGRVELAARAAILPAQSPDATP